MANELAVVVRAAVDDFINGMNKAKAEVKNFGQEAAQAFDKVEERSENLKHVWKDLFEAFIGVEMVDGLVKIADAAERAGKALEISAQNAKNFGKSFDETGMESWLRRFAASAQGGGYAVDAMRDSVQKFTSIGLDGAQTQRALADTANLAAAKNISFSEATQIVTMALTGHVDMLTRYGVISREAAKNIKTTEDAMRALEQATSGDAAKRADGLAGAFGRLGNSVSYLVEAFGKQLIPYLTGTANALTHMADAFSRLPDWVQKGAAGITFFTVGLTALGLILPAAKLGVEFLAGAFDIVKTAAGVAWKALGVLSDLIVGPMVGAFKGLISYVRTAIVALGTDLVGAEGAAALGASEFIAPALAIVAAIAGIAAAVVLLTGHWGDAMNLMSTAWSEFVNNILKSGPALKAFFVAVAESMNPQTMGAGIANLAVVTQAYMPKTSAIVGSDIDALKRDFMNGLQSVVNGIKSFFGFDSSGVGVPTSPFDNTVPGSAAKKGKKPENTAGETARINDSIDKQLAAWSASIGRKVEADLAAQIYREHPMSSTAGLDAQLESIRHAKAMEQAGGTLTPVKAARYDAREAAVKEQIAKINEENAARRLLIDQLLDGLNDTQARRQRIAADEKALAAAHNAVTHAANESAEALAKVAHDSLPQRNPDSILGRLTERAGIPLSAKGGLDWGSLLIQAAEKSKSFADIMKVVNELMQVFANIIDAFRPVIDLLLKGVIFVANGFISLWNVIAKILNMFGLHVQMLQKLSYDVQDAAAPFIKIVHDIPTLNELASGHVSPLYAAGTHDQIYNNITDPINQQLQQPSLGGGLLGALGNILEAILGLKVAMMLFGGGGGGMLGGIGKLFSFGGKSGMSGIEAALGGIHIGGATLGSAIAAVAGGAIVGNFVGDLFGGGSHSSWGSLGGAVGGGLGATLGMFGLAAGPLGALAGIAVGSLLGSVFGHADDPAKMPDKYMPGYQDWLQAYNNGSKSDTGWTLMGELQKMDPSKLTGQALADYQKLMGLGGSTQQLSITNEKDGNFTFDSGASDSVTDYISLVNRAMQEFSNGLAQTAGNVANAATAISQSINATTNDLASAAQASSNAGQAIVDAATAVINGANGTSSGKPPRTAAPITLHHYGDINNMGDLEEVGQKLALAQERAARTQRYRLDRVAGAPNE